MKIKKILILNLIIIAILMTIATPYSKATTSTKQSKLYMDTEISLYTPNRTVTGNDIVGREFFLKNAYSGQYMDVTGGVATNGTNVQQYKYNGTDSQKWYIHYNGDETFTFFTRLGASTAYTYALDISGGSGDNYANVQIYYYNASEAQKFKIGVAQNNTIVLYTGASNYTKAVVLNGPSLNQGANIDQYTFQSHVNEFWILEPVVKTPSLGVDYAHCNVNDDKSVYAYPDFRNGSGNCTNFVSQCMLASGIHYQSNWYIYRIGTNLLQIPEGDMTTLNNNWELADPSSWISAIEFANYWKNQVAYNYYKGSDILANPSSIANLGLVPGDVIQYAKPTLFNGLGDAQHTMYVTQAQNSTYYVTYHSGPGENINILDICNAHPNYYFIFYRMI